MARRVDMALLSAIDLSAQSKALEYDVISRQLWQSLRDAGAVGDVCSHYLDIKGKPVAARTINPTLDDLRSVPELILAAGGRQKVSIIRSVILARLCHVLITDESTASALLAEKSK
jgi:lsr operon transcriptional repressor